VRWQVGSPSSQQAATATAIVSVKRAPSIARPMSRPTRRYHLPSALRPSSLRINAAAAQSLVAGGALLVDCRRKDDVAHPLVGAARIPPDEIPAFASTLPPGVELVLACT
jgi:hypothetical protein